MVKALHRYHPFVLLLYYLGATTLVMLYKHPVFLLIGVLILAFFSFQVSKQWKFRSWFVMLILLVVMFLIINPLVDRRGTHILFYLRHNPIMLEGFIHGLILALSIFTLMVLFSSYNEIVTADRFLFLFSKWLPQWALLTMLAMRFVPLLKARLKEIETVQQGKGLSVKEGKLKERMRHGLLLVQILLTWSLEDAIQTADSMAARGYGLNKRSKYTPYYMTASDWLAVFIIVVIFAIGVFGWWLGDGVLTIYPVLETMIIQGREWFYLVIFNVYLGLPLIAAGREAMKWRTWKQKTSFSNTQIQNSTY
ncbi:energy-coupling factor transporter transmembrane component T [Metabacillus malikii]|nr:energy-coupling factor transporter transmembrane component T [Metabacillus malikii]